MNVFVLCSSCLAVNASLIEPDEVQAATQVRKRIEIENALSARQERQDPIELEDSSAAQAVGVSLGETRSRKDRIARGCKVRVKLGIHHRPNR